MTEAVKEENTKTPEADPKAKKGRAPKKKKSKPTNCAQSNKRIRRKDWYYRDGKYFANKQCYKLYQTQEAEKVKKAQEVSAAAAAPTPSAE